MDGYTITRLQASVDAIRLQQFLEECSDFYLLHEGCPTPADAGEYELCVVPDGRSVEDLHLFGMEAAGGRLVAFAQVVADYPTPGVWWIGTLLVTPALREHGLGTQLLRHVANVVSATGGQSLQLALSLNNPRGQKFWEAAGFRDTGQIRQVVARSGHVNPVRILVRDEANVVSNDLVLPA